MSTTSELKSFGVIDEKELAELSAVIELTRWVKDGNVTPYFLWCLRDFMLDYKQYQSSDDYMENVINVKNYDPNTERYRTRKNLSEFFKERGCLFFVRPVHDEKMIRNLEEARLEDLRPEFRSAVSIFKEKVMGHLKPKRFNNKILNGSAFVRLIGDILVAFNENKVPEIVSSVERIIFEEQKELLSVLEQKIDEFVSKHKDDIEEAYRTGPQWLWNEVYEAGLKKHDAELCSAIFGQAIDTLCKKLDQEAQSSNAKMLQEFDLAVENLIMNSNNDASNFKTTLAELFEEFKVNDMKLKGRFFRDKVLFRLIDRYNQEKQQDSTRYKAELEERTKDVETERTKRDNLNKYIKEQKTTVDEYTRKIDRYQDLLKQKNTELNTIKNIDNNEKTLLNQLSIYEERIATLEKENRDLQLKGGKALNQSLLQSGLFDQIDSMELTGDKAVQLKDYFEYLKEEVLKENSYLSDKVEQLLLENDQLKIQSVEAAEKDNIILELKEAISKLQSKRTSNTNSDQQVAFLIAETKRLKAEKMNFYYVIKELTKCLKKKKHQLKNALSMLTEEDLAEVDAVMEEFKIKY